MSADATAERERPSDDTPPDDEDLLARVDLLAEENRRLRAAYQSARRSRYRRTALGLLLVGGLALAGAVLFPGVRTVLLALGGTGVFAAVLTYFLTPERFVSASVGDHVVGAYADNEAAIADELGLAGTRVYVPTAGGPRLFIPQYETDEVPTDDALRATFVTGDDVTRGLALAPTGGRLYEEFERARAGPPADRPAALARQLADAAVEQFELVARADTERAGEGRLTVGLDDPVYRPADRFDHPVASLLGVGLATGLAAPVEVEVSTAGDDRYDALVTCSWTPEESDEGEGAAGDSAGNAESDAN
ncbi:hypothetical protein [Halomarina litorea]|uniref:hypothetical protein n=1 Tax=Halomarina litorea TaxID=2961595 RepID=UPI0020C317E6|nr:hypothetical protein [Halomarina sp. BCD28]